MNDDRDEELAARLQRLIEAATTEAGEPGAPATGSRPPRAPLWSVPNRASQGERPERGAAAPTGAAETATLAAELEQLRTQLDDAFDELHRRLDDLERRVDRAVANPPAPAPAAGLADPTVIDLLEEILAILHPARSR